MKYFGKVNNLKAPAIQTHDLHIRCYHINALRYAVRYPFWEIFRSEVHHNMEVSNTTLTVKEIFKGIFSEC